MIERVHVEKRRDGRDSRFFVLWVWFSRVIHRCVLRRMDLNRESVLLAVVDILYEYG